MKINKIFLVLTLITLPTLLPFFNPKFFYTQDHIFIARFHQISKALSDFHFPVRWAPDLRFGEPLYNFYAPLPYYVGAFIRLFGFNYIWVAKILFILSTLLSAYAMYLFCRKFFSVKAAILASVFYVYAPYRAVDIYVRGALSESWAFVFFPLIFYASTLISEKVTLKGIFLLSFSLAGLLLTHNVTTLIFLPFLVLWWFYLIFRNRNWRLVFHLLLSSVLAFGLSAFFLLPALFERQLIQTQYLIVGYFNFRAHFVAFYQFFSTFWGYGSSLWGLDDGLSFQVGLVHWIILMLAIFVGFINRSNIKLLILLGFLVSSFWMSLFLQHNKSAFIWEAIPLMAFVQFPWRFLAVSIFLIAFLSGVVSDNLKGKYQNLVPILIALVVLVNFQYFRPKDYVDDNFFEKFSNEKIMHKGVDLTKDYLPIWVRKTTEEYFDIPRARQGEISILNFEKKTSFAKGKIEVKQDSQIELPIAYFPGWEVRADEEAVTQDEPSELGLITFKLSPGIYNIVAEFKDTPVRTAGNFLTLGSFLVVAALLGLKKFK